MKRSIIFFSLFLLLAPSSVVHAQDFDARCFTRTECIEARENQIKAYSGVTGSRPEDGFYAATEHRDMVGNSCPDEMYGNNGKKEEAGFCLPIADAQLTVSIGGKRSFPNIAEYINYVYRYSIIAAVVLVTVMLLIGGIQWAASGGSPQAIDAAKKRIANAMTGLLLVLCAYMILYTINPELTQLRQPQTWLLKQILLTENSCRDIEGDPLFTRAEDDNGDTIAYNEENFSNSNAVTKSNTTCGYEHYISGAGGQTCTGSVCEKNEACGLKLDEERAECVPGSIVGNVYSTNLIQNGSDWITRSLWYYGTFSIDPLGVSEGWRYPWAARLGSITGLADAITLYSVCDDGYFHSVTQSDLLDLEPNPSNQSQFFSLKVNENIKIQMTGKCARNNPGTEHKGYVLVVGLDEFQGVGSEYHILGYNGGTAIDMGKYFSTPILSWINTCTLKKPSIQEFLITDEQIKDGIQVDIDVARVVDIDGDDVSNIASWAGLETIITSIIPGGQYMTALYRTLTGEQVGLWDSFVSEYNAAYGSIGVNINDC